MLKFENTGKDVDDSLMLEVECTAEANDVCKSEEAETEQQKYDEKAKDFLSFTFTLRSTNGSPVTARYCLEGKSTWEKQPSLACNPSATFGCKFNTEKQRLFEQMPDKIGDENQGQPMPCSFRL